MTQEQKENLAKVFDAKAEKEQSMDSVANKVATALVTDILTKDWVKTIVGASGDKQRRVFLQAVAYFHPHYVLNGSNKVIACDFITATEENMDSKTIHQYRLSVDSEVQTLEVCKNYVEMEREEKKMQKFTVTFDETGFSKEIEVPVMKNEKEYVTETKKVQLVPRKKSVFGFTKEMKTAVINAIEAIENGTFVVAEEKESK